MLWCGYQPFGTTQHMRHFHQMIVDNISKVVRWETVRFYYYWIAFIAHINASLAKHQVCELRHSLGLQFEP